MDSLYVAMVLTVAILVASMVSVELALSVSIIEIILGVALGNALGLSAPEWLVFLAGVGAILLTFLAGAEVDPGEFRATWRANIVVAIEWPLIVEAKAHGLTEPGRRGAPARVEKVAGHVIEKALEQTRRAVTYVIDEGKRDFAKKQGAPPVRLLPADIAGATEVIVTFERIDPLAMLGPAAVQQEGRPVWVVSIADLLMAADITTQASCITTRVPGRTPPSTDHGSSWSPMRSAPILRIDSPLWQRERRSGRDEVVLLGYSSDAINDYYTANELGFAKPKPTTGMASDVSAALAHVMMLNTGLWAQAVDAVMGAPPEAWRRWRKSRRRHRDRRRFALTPNLQLLAAPDTALTTEEGILVLHIAAASSTANRRLRGATGRT